jgi:hypothetical protein
MNSQRLDRVADPVEAGVRLSDQLPVETLLDATGLVAAAQDDGLAQRVEGEGKAPDAVRRVEAQCLSCSSAANQPAYLLAAGPICGPKTFKASTSA